MTTPTTSPVTMQRAGNKIIITGLYSIPTRMTREELQVARLAAQHNLENRRQNGHDTAYWKLRVTVYEDALKLFERKKIVQEIA